MRLNESFELHDELNPKLWGKNDKLLPEVRDRLLLIVDQFKDSLEIGLSIIDSRIVGSNASFNYTDASDIDLHLVVNYSLLDASPEILQALFNALKTKFNSDYDITIKGIPVEIYVEDVGAGTATNGIYSLTTDSWIKFPKPIEVPEEIATSNELGKLKSEYDRVIAGSNSEDIESLINKVYMIRKDAIDTDGEFSAGNQLFKDFRNAGYLDKLKSVYKDMKSQELTLEKLSLREDTRNKLMSKSKQSAKGLQRFKRRLKSRVANSVKQYNSIDMNKLFKQDILTVDINVTGETNEYVVKISFGGFLELLLDQINNQNGKLDLKAVTRALVNGFNKDDVYIHCSCPDWKYRYNYYATKNQISSGAPENRPSNITNPNDTLGSACKHVLLVLSNASWIIKVGATIYNYINYMQKHYQKLYADIIYPAIYNKEYEEPVQLSIDDVEPTDELDSTSDTIDKSNKFAVDNSKFQKGNTQGIRFASSSEDEEQLDLDDEL